MKAANEYNPPRKRSFEHREENRTHGAPTTLSPTNYFTR